MFFFEKRTKKLLPALSRTRRKHTRERATGLAGRPLGQIGITNIQLLPPPLQTQEDIVHDIASALNVTPVDAEIVGRRQAVAA